AKQVLNKEIEAEGLIVLAWRVIPTHVDALGEIALQSMPAFEQIIVNCPMGVTEVEFNRKLFLARRRAEQLLLNDTSFYVTTLCSTVISYKGLMMPEAIADFYTDLADERLESLIVVFHQRCSTNTLPRWPLAQPFRYLAHYGEINTITANRNWAMARVSKFENPLLPGLTELKPIVNRTGSD